MVIQFLMGALTQWYVHVFEALGRLSHHKLVFSPNVSGLVSPTRCHLWPGIRTPTYLYSQQAEYNTREHYRKLRSPFMIK